MSWFKDKNQESVYTQLKNQMPSESTRYRDVYESQQIQRSKIGSAGSMAVRNIFTWLCAICGGLLVWVFFAVLSFGSCQLKGMGPSAYVAEKQAIVDALYFEELQGARDAYAADPEANTEKFDETLLEAVPKDTYDVSGHAIKVYPGADFLNSTPDDFHMMRIKGENRPVYAGADEIFGSADDYIKVDINADGRLEAIRVGEDLQYFTSDDVCTYVIQGFERQIHPGGDNEYGTSDDMVQMERVDAMPGFGYFMLHGNMMYRLLFTVIVSLCVYAFMKAAMKKNWEAQNVMYDTADINQYENDQHIQVPEEIQENYDWFPDVGAHSPVQVSSLISHMALTNKGLKSIQMTQRANKNILDSDGSIMYYEGEALVDDDGKELVKKASMIDEKFMDDLWTISELPQDKMIRRKFDPSKIPYNPGNKNRDKLKDADTVADMINKYWTFPSYEPQRPGGAYIVDTQPVNTMVLAITRAGKGQTIIEPTLDMWTREETPNNMIINDPKGELLVKFYVRGTVRGFQIVQFNLINAMKTDIYNPLGIAAEAAREGDFTKCALYVENIADVFFPLDGGDDPVWPNAANNAFKRAAYGLIDFYLEEEKALRLKAAKSNMSPQVLETKIDQMWGKVTLYNCYQLFVQLTSKKLKNPVTQLQKKVEEAWDKCQRLNKAIGFNVDENGVRTPSEEGPDPSLSPADIEVIEEELAEIEYWLSEEGQAEESKRRNEMSLLLWEDKPEADLLTLYFNATAGLPRNQMRTLINNANNALRAMAGAEKMLASVYGIAITAMSFFTDPTISTLTSGTLSQNVDLGGLSFPRRFGVRFNPEFIQKYSLLGMQCRWMSFTDKTFTQEMGRDFYHEDILNREGWAMYYFKGIYPDDIAYMRLQIVDPSTELLIRSFYFRFKKDYQKSLDGRYYMTDPVTGSKIVKNGILTELVPAGEVTDTDGNVRTNYRTGHTTFSQMKVLDPINNPTPEPVETPTIMRSMVRYSEKPKMVFLVTPPHLMKYAKLILILISQLVNFNFDKSYMTKSSQKPLYKTRFMLDELGNLQSEGHGISNFQTMLSIGLGQEQQFTIILQTLQQLRDVYGESVDKIVQGNTSNIIFLKSTDDSMLDTLQKMSGIRHVTMKESKTVTKDLEKLVLATEGKVSYQFNAKELPVIAYNDLAFLNKYNAIVFRAGDPPIWNRNETILLMSFRLFQNTIIQPGKNYSLQTIPTLSTALDFDVRKNQPDFIKMWEKRRDQALKSEEAQRVYRDAYGYSDQDIARLDPDVWSDEIMRLIDDMLNVGENSVSEDDDNIDADAYEEDAIQSMFADSYGLDDYEENTEQLRATEQSQQKADVWNNKIFAENTMSPAMFCNASGTMTSHNLDDVILDAYRECKAAFHEDRMNFRKNGVGLSAADGTEYIVAYDESAVLKQVHEMTESEDNRAYAEPGAVDEQPQTGLRVTDEFLRFLAHQDNWSDFASGKFEIEMAKAYRRSIG